MREKAKISKEKELLSSAENELLLNSLPDIVFIPSRLYRRSSGECPPF
jgi:hypothetical protein